MANNRESSPLLSDARNENNQELGQACSIVEESAVYSADDERKRVAHIGKQRFDIWDRSTPAVPLVTLLLVAVAGFVSVGLVSTLSFDGPRRPSEPGQYGPSIAGDGAAGVSASVLPGKRDQHGVDPGHGLPTTLFDKKYVSRPANNAHERPLVQHQQPQKDLLTPSGFVEGVARAVGEGREKEGRSDDAERDNRKAGVSDTKGTKPNVFIFFIDDMGWNDMGYQSTDLNMLTPNMDRLAAGGVKLTNYYSMHVCTPARAALMTGRYPVRYGMQYGVVSGGATWGMPPQEKIMPQYFNSGGYVSHMVGKWHLGMYLDELMPNNRGFETYLGYLHGEDDYWTHQNTRAELLDSTHFYDFGFGNSTGYYDVNPKPPQTPLAPGKTAVESFTSSDKDMTSMFDFSELANPNGWEDAVMKRETGPHRSERPRSAWKMSTDAAVIDEGSMDYLDIYSEDVFLSRATRILNSKTPWDDEPLFLYLAHQAVHAPLTPVPDDAFSEEEEAILTSIESTKESRVAFARVGELVHTLEENGWMENSIIVVASDNGGCPSEGSINYPLRGTKETYFEGGIKVPAFIYSKSHLPEEVWGSTYNHPMHVTDWVPTFASAVGFDLGGSPGPLDGVDHWDSIINPTDNSIPPRDEILFNWDDYILSSSEELTPNEQLTQGAFRQGKWKLITNQWCSNYVSYDPDTQDDALLSNNICGSMKVCPACVTTCSGDIKYTFHDWLFDLEKDPREVTNLAEVYPETVSRLRERAREVAHSDYGHSGYQKVDRQAYKIWADNGCWIFPWYRLAHDAPSL